MKNCRGRMYYESVGFTCCILTVDLSYTVMRYVVSGLDRVFVFDGCVYPHCRMVRPWGLVPSWRQW